MRGMWRLILLVALAGAVGTLARYGLSRWVDAGAGTQFAWGTLAVNMIGCFLFGLVYAWAERHVHLKSELRIVLLTGFMGAFTTFSTYAFETGQGLREGRWGFVLANIAAQNVLGVALVLAGLALGGWLAGRA